MLGRVTETDERRDTGKNRTFKVGSGRTDRWPTPGWRILLVMARHALMAVVRISSSNHTPYEGKFISRLCNRGQMLADINSGYIRVYRLEGASDL